MNKLNKVILNPLDYDGNEWPTLGHEMSNWPEYGCVMMNFHNRSSSGYQFSVGSKDHILVKQLKIKCAEHNKWIRETARKHNWMLNNSWQSLKRVSLKARGPRAKHAKAMGYHPRAFDQALPHEFAKYFDVYYVDDTYNTWMFNHRQNDKLEYQKLERQLEEILETEDAKAKIIAKMKELKCNR